MTTELSDMQTSLDGLRQEVRRLRHRLLVCIAAFSAALYVAVWGPESMGDNRTITTHCLRILNAKDVVCAEIASLPETGPYLAFADTANTTRLFVGLGRSEVPVITLSNEAGEDAAGMYVTPDGTGMIWSSKPKVPSTSAPPRDEDMQRQQRPSRVPARSPSPP